MHFHVFLIYGTDRLSGLEKGTGVPQCFSVRSIPRDARNASHVRLHDNAVVANEVRAAWKSAGSGSSGEEHLLNLGLAVEHVQPSTTNLSRLQCLDQCLLVSERSAAGVDEEHPVFHGCKLFERYHALGLLI